MHCKRGAKKRSGFQETEAKSCESNKIPKTMHACIVEVHESTRQRLESSPPKIISFLLLTFVRFHAEIFFNFPIPCPPLLLLPEFS